MTKECCKNCRFWFRPEGTVSPGLEATGECRRYPPASVGDFVFAYPMLDGWYWCGEFVYGEQKG